LVEFVKQQREPEYDDTVTAEAEKESASQDNDEQDIYRDELLERAVNLVMESGQASVSMLQRRFRIGYTRAARLVDTMEDLKIVGPNMGSKAREILMSPEQVKARYFSDSEE
jgi:putative stage III sporulation protein E